MSNWFGDVAAVTSRNFSRLKRSPDVVGFALFQPVMFVLLFSQVYGGAIQVPGSNYTEFLMAGIFAQTVVFGATFSGTFMAQDLKEGIVDRFRTLPMSQAAVLFARTFTDLAINTVSMIVMLLAGLAVGWRFNDGVPKFLAGVALLLFFAWAFSWVLVFVGLVVSTPETLNNAVFIILFPLTFISNAFVPSDTLPTVLRVLESGLRAGPGRAQPVRQSARRPVAGRVDHAAPGHRGARRFRGHCGGVHAAVDRAFPPQGMTVRFTTSRRTPRPSPTSSRARPPMA